MFDIDASTPIARLLLAHGAGADMHSDFMQQMASELAQRGISVRLFNFPYMVKREQDGKKRPPDRFPVLQDSFNQQIERCESDVPLFIGGKSMGGRVATTILQQADTVRACICLGYPFHPPGKPEKLRTEHLVEMAKPVLIVQGERDTFGNQQEIADYVLSETIKYAFCRDGDHSLKPRKSSGLSHDDNITFAADHIAQFVREQI
ncbi:alpha/beta fold hydrolase [Aestuariibacter salexigens]|uniref:alpha/beta fold hydrolase n=1 Tax=Aestuariibacter salexigens TaxID=226010 RepID=UPI0003FEEABD|nr:alpha/beta fold hydrolase [Aestuariibacter salexigens]